MPDLSTIGVFLGASLILLVVPGPAVLYIVARSIAQGRSAGIVSALGIATGSLPYIAAVVLGVSAVLLSAPIVFRGIQALGAGYLLYLGTQKLREKVEHTLPGSMARESLPRIFRQGILVSLLNPKSVVFFLAFLPQFIDPSRGPAAPQALFLSSLFLVVAFASDGVYALLAGTLGNWLQTHPRFLRVQNVIAGGILVALGVGTAVAVVKNL